MALVESVKYGLSSAENSQNSSKLDNFQSEVSGVNGGNGKKSVIFVKLTDSALKAIEDYLRSQKTGVTGDRATLQFLGNEGRIKIPSSNHNGHTFDFSLSSNADSEGPQGSFECIQQTGSSSLESMGTVPYKMRIHANEDVYEATKLRFSALGEKAKQECAKEIKPNNADIGRKVKTKFSRHSEPSSTNFGTHKRSSLPQPSNLTNSHRVNNGYYTNHNHTNSVQPGQPPYHRLNTTDINNQIKQNYNTTSGNAPPPRYSGSLISGGDVTRRPLKERIIHLLALKSYKKPELHNRLTKEGLKPKEQKLVTMVLRGVSTMKGNEYFINRGIWNDVNENWPFYTEEERQVMKRRKPQNLTPPGSDCSVGSGTSGSSLSPPSSSGHSGSSPPSSFSTSHYDPLPSNLNGMLYNNANSSSHHMTKRTGDLLMDNYDDIPSKRQRISHIVREEPNKKPELAVEEKPSVRIESNSNTIAYGNKVDSDSFLNKYTPIRTPEQRTRYKMDFNNEYKHYRDVHSVIEKVGNRFAQFQAKLQQVQRGTPAYDAVRNEIYSEYSQTKKDRRYVEAKKAFPILHEKLSHIKQMVEDYDRTHSSNSAGYGSQYETYQSV